MELNKLPLGEPQTAVASFVTLLADLCALDEVKMACYLDCYYQLRKHAEDAEKLEPVVPTTAVPDLSQEEANALSDMAATIVSSSVGLPKSVLVSADAPFPPPGFLQKTEAEEVSDAAPDPAPMPPKGFVPVRPNPLRGGASAKFKKETRERLEALRKTSDLSLQAIADASGGTLTLSDLLSILECQKVDLSLYLALSQTLDNVAN